MQLKYDYVALFVHSCFFTSETVMYVGCHHSYKK